MLCLSVGAGIVILVRESGSIPVQVPRGVDLYSIVHERSVCDEVMVLFCLAYFT